MHQKEIDALKKVCLYCIPPNRLGYCGPAESWRCFQTLLSSPSQANALAAMQQLKKFNALHPYLELIAKANRLQPFDEEVVEAYWLGNELLRNVQYSEIQKIILSFQRFGLPKSIAERKAEQLPDNMLPHHSMHVLYINFLTPKVKPIVQNLGNCLVQWGKVQEKTTKGINIKGIELFAESNELKLREKTKIVQNPFRVPLQPGDLISVHWGNAIERISASNLKNLEKITGETIAGLQAK